MLLAIDIGNTNIVLGLWNGASWQLQWRLQTNRDRTADEYGIYIRGLLKERKVRKKKLDQVVLSSVVPRLTAVFTDLSQRYLRQKPLVVSHLIDTGIQIRTDFPEQVGADRIVNATAAYHKYKAACIVVDMGTATKFETIDRQGNFLGGVISPGLQITSDALFSRAAKLSQVDLVAPPSAIGRNTTHALQSGLVLGYASLIDGLIPRLKAEMIQLDPELASQQEVIPVVGTGGLIELIAPYTNTVNETDPWLTLSGLRIIAERNQASSRG